MTGFCVSGDFRLTKFTSNKRGVLEAIPEKERTKGHDCIDLSCDQARREGGAGGSICPGPQPMEGPQNEEVKQIYKLYRERCLKNWMHFKVCGKMT